MTADRLRLLLVDDQALVRAGFAMVLGAQSDMTVVGEAGDGVEAIEAVRRLRPDVVLMDVRMPRMDGVEATRRIVADTASRVVVLTTFDLDEYVHAALRAGASAFLLKDAGPEELLAAVRAVARGDQVVAPSATRRLLSAFLPVLDTLPAAGDPAVDPRLAALTERERDVLQAVGEGLNNAEIARTRYLAEATVKTHIGHILAKLQLRDRVQMVVLAYDCGIVSPQR